MKFSAPLVVAAAALGVSAHPSGQNNHAHNLAHRSAQQFVKYVQPVPEPTTTAAPPPAPKPTVEEKKPEPKPEPEAGIFKEETKEEPKEEKKKPEQKEVDNSGSSSSGGEGEGVDSYTPFCGGAKTKRATLAEIAYTGNVGTDGNYGCNMMLAKSSAAKEYKYKAKITNAQDEEQHCVAYLKIGPKGLIDGFFKGNQVLDFKIPAGATQYVVADENTQGGVICDVGSVPVAGWGEWASTWAEWDFGNESNDGWSGADASSLVASRQGLNIPGMSICGPCGGNTCSKIWPGGKGENAFTKGMEAEDGWGLNCVAGPLELDIIVGWTGN